MPKPKYARVPTPGLPGIHPLDSVLRRSNVPLGLVVPCAARGKEQVAYLFPPNGHFYVQGVRSFNSPFEVVITRLSAGGTDNNLIPREMDSAAFTVGAEMPEPGQSAEAPPEYDHEAGYYPQDWGCVTRDCPLTVVYRAHLSPVVPPHLNWVVYGTHLTNAYNSCAPSDPLPAQSPCSGCGRPAPYAPRLFPHHDRCRDCAPDPT